MRERLICEANISTVMQEGNDAGIIQILWADMVPDVHAGVPGLHTSAHLDTGGVDFLQRHLTKRLEATIVTAAHFERGIVEEACDRHRKPAAARLGR